MNFGIIGFGLFYGFTMKLFKIAYSYIRKNKDPFCGFIVVFIIVRLISDIGNVSYYDKFLYIMFGVSISYFKFKINEERTV